MRLSQLALTFALGCAPSKPPAYVEARASAERNYANGRYQQAARDWSRAASSARYARDREEALYRVATSRERSGDGPGARAAYEELLRSFPDGSRAPRAAYELASLELEAGHDDVALEQYVAMIERHPDSGLAGRALDRCLVRILSTRDLEAKLAFLARLSHLEDHEVGEHVAYRRATLLYENDRIGEAGGAFLKVAEQYPYPKGAYWDDALWYAADCERRQGRPEAAVALLRRMLGERESAHFQGSYQRPRYAQAQFRIAEIYRDDLAQPERAMRAFHRVFANHDTSLLRDDALWQEARIARELGMESKACQSLSELVSEIPESRFVGCTRLLCPSAGVDRTLPCRRYIERELQSPSREAKDDTN